jgi:hypothetical protein
LDESTFWQIIEKSRIGCSRFEEEQLCANLTKCLDELTPEQISCFEYIFELKMLQSYNWDLWAIAYIIGRGCSDDGFDYFRYWLIAQGKDYYKAIEDPQSVADSIEPGQDPSFESISSCATDVYEEMTDSELRVFIHYVDREPTGASWDDRDLQIRFPEACRKFGFNEGTTIDFFAREKSI